MWIKELALIFIGITSGLAISAGVFAFLITMGVVPRMVGKSNTASQVFAYENSIFFGGIFGNIMSIFPVSLPIGISLIVLFGLSAGIFTGCLAVALAEILNAFPIMFRRLKIKMGLKWILYFMAFGKTLGSLYFYMQRLGS
ncbi:stage V sporulation protein AB [Lachnospiraceae bacterium ZAX-1]